MYCNANAALEFDSVYKQDKFHLWVCVEEWKYVLKSQQCNMLSDLDGDDRFL